MPRRKIKDYRQISLRPEDVRGRIDFVDIFGRTADLHIEVGSGKGTFLISAAQAHPEASFLGIEWANKYYKLAVDRMGRWNIPNVRIIRTDAADFLTENIPDISVNWFHIYYPDPWPKKKHHKRRFISHENIKEILRCLKTAGIINIATDHAGYFEQIQEVLHTQAQSGTIEIVNFTRAPGAKDGEKVGTNYERKYIIEGRESYTIAAKKL